MLEIIKDKIVAPFEPTITRAKINEQAKQLKQLFIKEGSKSSPGGLYLKELNNVMVMSYFDGSDFDAFELNIKLDDNDNNIESVLGIGLGDPIRLCSLAAVLKTDKDFFLEHVDYDVQGKASSQCRMINEAKANFLIENKVPLIKSGDRNLYPSYIRPKMATLNLLKLMNCEEPNFGVYVQAVQAAAV